MIIERPVCRKIQKIKLNQHHRLFFSQRPFLFCLSFGAVGAETLKLFKNNFAQNSECNLWLTYHLNVKYSTGSFFVCLGRLFVDAVRCCLFFSERREHPLLKLFGFIFVLKTKLFNQSSLPDKLVHYRSLNKIASKKSRFISRLVVRASQMNPFKTIWLFIVRCADL